MKTQHASDASKRDGNATEQYFAAEPSSEDVRRRMKVTLRGQDAVVEVSNGVFSGSRLDLGTSVLLREVPEPPETGTLLDLGCGWGPVSLALAVASPKADVGAVDVNERALDLTRANAKSNGCEHIMPRRRRRCRPICRSTRSGRPRRSASARTRCTTC